MRAHLRSAPKAPSFLRQGTWPPRAAAAVARKKEETNLRKRASSKERNEASGSNNLRNPAPKCKFHRRLKKDRGLADDTEITRIRGAKPGAQNKLFPRPTPLPPTFTQVDNFSFFFFLLFTIFFAPFKVSFFLTFFLFVSSFSHFYYLRIFFCKLTPKVWGRGGEG